MRPAQEIIGQVQAASWTRSIEIWELQEVTKQGWRDEIPSGAALGQCTKKHHHTQDEPAPNATEVCGTPYVIDKGTGYGEVVQDCEYRVYNDWCKYTAKEWGPVDVITLKGTDLHPRWPDPILGAQQRGGEREETYEVVFETEKGTYTYETSDAGEFARFEMDSRWVLKVGPLGGVRPVEQAQ